MKRIIALALPTLGIVPVVLLGIHIDKKLTGAQYRYTAPWAADTLGQWVWSSTERSHTFLGITRH